MPSNLYSGREAMLVYHPACIVVVIWLGACCAVAVADKRISHLSLPSLTLLTSALFKTESTTSSGCFFHGDDIIEYFGSIVNPFLLSSSIMRMIASQWCRG